MSAGYTQCSIIDERQINYRYHILVDNKAKILPCGNRVLFRIIKHHTTAIWTTDAIGNSDHIYVTRNDR